MRHAIIIGTGSYVPENIMTNDDMAKLVDTSDEWIASRTGIRARRISTGENTSDLAYKAANKALQNANIEARELDLIICATITPDSFMPSVACIVQERLGAANAAAFDLTAACTGLIYGMASATAFIESGMYKNIMIIGAETISKALDWTDRSTCVLFGDGAGAVVMQASDVNNGVMAVHLVSDGSKQDYLCLPAFELTNPYIPRKDDYKPTISMKGQEVFKFAVRSITDHIKVVLEKASLREEDIKYIVTHQANCRIIEHAARTSGITIDKFFINIDRYANTSAATIGIALDEMVEKNLLQSGDKVILVGFGAGMTSGAILVEWN
ncbi:ketoacyl-ACP synthase III [Lachnospiraceae bacterium MD1]|uniref:Beta-ketoacyl-[acyl-carrier-protein] synthase III n=1 Tax=Variimorphobacter saccharofermentans TaxID=2755051 RepID=A0A839JXV4_9FIRM|nr:beta-ketoacyl-ACP synthase III [Variimorphobacter saccharofermentans]MBB2182260.1 ketoacyl-ACP synthase III [Variimorphobacter saccharofermentans]